MRILITGNMGYVGSVLTRYLKQTHENLTIIGYDNAYFGHCLTSSNALPEIFVQQQVFGDIRDFPAELLDGVDAVVHLSAVSNDPMGNKFEDVTLEINQACTLSLAEAAAARGVRNFVFASSCSIYGCAEGGARTERDGPNPLTAYARSKVGSEQAMCRADLGAMTVTSLRFATACGMSDRLRLDLVLNDFVAGALATGNISILSDGSPWRPLIDVEDMARAISWAIDRTPDLGGKFLAVNTGRNDANYQVRELADRVAHRVAGTRVSINANAPPDKRSYQVDFSLFAQLAPAHVPHVSLDQSIDRLHGGLEAMGFMDVNFRDSSLIRLRALDKHMVEKRLGSDLRWMRPVTGSSF